MKSYKKILPFFVGFILMFALSDCSTTDHDLFSSIHGIVSNASTGEPVANAIINLSPGGRSTVSGNDGQFEFLELDPGQYTITVQCTGYATNRKTINAVSAESVRADIPLTPSQNAQ